MPIARQSRSLESAQLINEKILQRYVFEMLSKSTDTRRKLLPDDLKSRAKKFRVLIPEYPLSNPDHRTDFRLIFNDGTNRNVEVEWTTSRFHHGGDTALAHYSKDAGFVVVLQDDRSHAPSYTNDIVVVAIDPEEFFWWFAKNAPRLLGATIALHADGYQVRETKYWVIYVGKEGGAEDDYIVRGFPKGVWAFRYVQGKNFANVSSINRGDIVVFTTGWKGTGGRQIYAGKNWSTSRVDVLKVTKGYWCDYSDGTFEISDWDQRPETKQYMHYFAYDKMTDSEKLFKKGQLSGKQFQDGDMLDKEICYAMRMSNTQRGSPYELSQEAFARLLQHLHAMTPLLKIT